MLLLCWLCAAVPPAVRYSSVVQIKNVYSKNRLTVTADQSGATYEQPWIYASRPPFDDGWLWTIEPAEGGIALARETVKCGDNITLMNPNVNSYLATRVTFNGVEVVPAPAASGEGDHWQVQCREADVWVRDAQIMLKNRRHGCFLSTSLDVRQRETVNKFNVTCSSLSQEAVWKAVEGVYFGEGKAQNKDAMENEL